MQKKYYALIIIAVIIVGAGILEHTSGTVSGLVFNEMKYNYSSHVLIPANEANGSSLGGYYTVNGSGHNFNILMKLTGGTNDTSSPLDYTSDGLHVTGHIDTIKVTPETLIALYENNLKDAMFRSVFNGSMNMTCSVWTGKSYFQNNGQKLTGTFTITGVITDWEGNYTITSNPNNLILDGDYIYYPHGNKTPDNTRFVHKDYYL